MTSRHIRIATLVLAIVGACLFVFGLYGISIHEKPGLLILSTFNMLVGFVLMLWNFRMYLKARDGYE